MTLLHLYTILAGNSGAYTLIFAHTTKIFISVSALFIAKFRLLLLSFHDDYKEVNSILGRKILRQLPYTPQTYSLI